MAVQPVPFEMWAEKVLGEGVRSYGGPWLTSASDDSSPSGKPGNKTNSRRRSGRSRSASPAAGSSGSDSDSKSPPRDTSDRVIRHVALEHCYIHWSARRKEFGCSLVRSLRELQVRKKTQRERDRKKN